MPSLRSHEHGRRHSLVVGPVPHEVTLLATPGPRRVEAIPGADIAGRRLIARRQFLDRRHEFRTGPEVWRSKVDVIEHLHRGRPVGDVLHRIGPRHPLPVGMQRECGRHPQGVKVKPRLVDGARERDRAGSAIERHIEMVGGEVGDPPMQRMLQAACLVKVGGAVAHQTAAGHELVEPVKPAKPRRLDQRHEPRMHRAMHG